MLETVIISAVVVSFGTFVVKSRMESNSKFAEAETSWNDTLLSFVKENGLDGLDILFKDQSDLKKKISNENKVTFIAPTVKKGYDLVDTFLKGGYSFGPHFHNKSSEFFYVLSGKIRVSQCRNSPTECSTKCGNNCGLYSDTPYNKDNVVSTLGAGDNLFVPESKFHTFEALEDSRVIVVTLPPISEIEYNGATQ